MQIFLLCTFSAILTHLFHKSNLLEYWKANLHVQGQAEGTQEKYLHTSSHCKTLSMLLPSSTGKGKVLWTVSSPPFSSFITLARNLKLWEHYLFSLT